jgi:hypothetical protein
VFVRQRAALRVQLETLDADIKALDVALEMMEQPQ